ncbi:MAG: hypothetical protein JXQ73_04255 [Phycisphaerae bacterium]|nr:hypothetical protein [Phycisphaerae bacterium]
MIHIASCACLIGLLFISIAAQAASPSATSSHVPAHKPFFKTPWLLGAHRGGAMLWPQNTVVAFKAAAERWPDVVLECDARTTADGHAILMHDGTVDATTNGSGAAGEMTLAQIKELDAGYRFTPDGGKTFPWRGKGVVIPTLAEALAACPSSRFEIELKPSKDVVEPTVRAIREAKAEDRVLLASFDVRLIREACRLLPRVASCYDFADGLQMQTLLRKGGKAWEDYRPTSDVLSMMENMLKQFGVTPSEIRAMQAKGIYFQIHTPNTRESIVKRLELGPDSVLTDRPDLLAEIIAERAKK